MPRSVSCCLDPSLTHRPQALQTWNQSAATWRCYITDKAYCVTAVRRQPVFIQNHQMGEQHNTNWSVHRTSSYC